MAPAMYYYEDVLALSQDYNLNLELQPRTIVQLLIINHIWSIFYGAVKIPMKKREKKHLKLTLW